MLEGMGVDDGHKKQMNIEISKPFKLSKTSPSAV